MQTNLNLEVNLKSEQVQVKVLRILLLIVKFLPIGAKIKQKKLEMVINILILASATNSSIHETCKDHKATRTGVTVRNMLKLIFAEIQTVEQILNRLLKATIKRKLLRGSHTVITDLIEIEYYGKPYKCDDEIRNGHRKNGTNAFHTYATVYIYVKEQRYTLAITYVQAHDTMLADGINIPWRITNGQSR